ncbi:acetyl esterase/lipase [Sphingomonas zeicaulis]|uniref:alpha/beta fold hydrolase n=1 Tax=Sphingomonas zeicaulis TaxID=1632740 RepID=UPI003D1AE95F
MLIPLRILAAGAMLIAALGGAVPSWASAPVERAYGADQRQRLDFYPAEQRDAPLIVFVHGGGWSAGDKRMAAGDKPDHFVARGFAFASVNYRLVPDVSVADQAADIAHAIAWLEREAPRLGVDARRIVLMGHSAGAHLAALLATDPAYLRDAGARLENVRGAILLDGAGYDIAERMRDAGPFERRLYERAFGTDPAQWHKLSPSTHAAAPNAAGWLLLHVRDRADSQRQADALAEMLREAGNTAIVDGFDTTHGRLNRELGTAGDRATAVVDAFLDSCFGENPEEIMGVCTPRR